MNAQSTFFTYATQHGPVTMRATARGLVEVVFDRVELEGTNAPNAVTNEAATQLSEYLAGKRREFDVPLDPKGSSFQKAVWTEVCTLPFGETATAAIIAERLGKPGAHRSVGTAINQCKLAPFIPVQRVIAPNATGRKASILRAFQALEARSV